MNTHSTKAKAAAVMIMQTILETVAETPEGAPQGPLFAAFQAHGLPLDTFQAVIEALVGAELLSKRGWALYITPKGRRAARIG